LGRCEGCEECEGYEVKIIYLTPTTSLLHLQEALLYLEAATCGSRYASTRLRVGLTGPHDLQGVGIGG